MRDLGAPRSLVGSLPAEMGRVRTDEAIEHAAEALRENITDALKDFSLPSNDIQRCVDTVLSVHADWKTLKARAFEIGRKLLALHDSDRNVYQALVKNRAVFPFDATVATKLRMIAECLYKEKRVLIEELPPNWTTAYEIVTMDAPTLEFCRQENLLGETARISSLRNAKRARQNKAPNTVCLPDRLAQARKEQARLESQKDVLQDQIDAIDNALVGLRAEIAKLSGEPISDTDSPEVEDNQSITELGEGEGGRSDPREAA